MSRKPKDEYYRFFSVSEPRTHEKGHTEYKVTARFVSKRHPEDVKEVVVWKRFSELKKLHGELAYTHKNLFRRQEFPPFPRAQVFGRFDDAVIEERRKATEAMLLFVATVPALYNSPQLKDFFRAGEVTRPLDPTPLSSVGPLPPPLIPLPKRRASDCEPAEEEEGKEAPTLPQDLGNNLALDVGQPEVAAEADSEMKLEEEEEEEEELSDTEQSEKATPTNRSPARTDQSQEAQEEFDSLFDSVDEPVSSPKEKAPPPLSDNDLAVFDPCYKQGEDKPDAIIPSGGHSELLSLPPAGPTEGGVAYLNQAAIELTAAMEREQEGDFSTAIRGYRVAVDVLINGVQGDVDPSRRESVMKRISQYLQHAETLVSRHSSPAHTHTDTHTH